MSTLKHEVLALCLVCQRRAAGRWLPAAIAAVVVLVACGAPSVKDQAQQIVEERQRVAAVETMTGLLKAQQAAESRGTAVAVAGRVTATAVALGVQQTATVGSIQAGETATASAAQVAVRETQAPIIAAATVAAAQEAASIQATAIVTAAQEAASIQATAIVEAAHRAQTLAAQATATAQVDAARGQADVQAQRSAFAAWQQRYIAAAHFAPYCPQASHIASQTKSVPEAVATAQASDSGYHNCIVATATPEPHS